MRITISVDIEGVAGVCEAAQGVRGNSEYESARRLMSEEANAAIRGAFSGGASEVVVADSHGMMRNLLAEELDPRARIISGKPRPLSMIEGVQATDAGIVLIGYHAGANHRGVLAHTISGQAFRQITINDVHASETTLFAGYASEIGVPLLAVSGDDALACEVGSQFPSCQCIVVKQALGAAMCNSLSPVKARELIEKKVKQAVSNAAGMKADAPTKPPLHVKVDLNKQIFADAAELVPTLHRSGAQQIEFTADSHKSAIGILSTLALLAKALA
ncbi:M55 family metallopeptidase [Polycladidibacter stylochi]|uniref:M55 family metallopeptidase n=1 Tax=Polycladidibacter stylochi TaxID=1807766 RepID=UPI00082FBEDA|nr:M55 family metallopeptidase [Pseudovibrio stylochi]